MMMNVYFDNAASTQLDPRVFEKMLPYLKESYGNPSSIHSYGRKVRVAVESAREIIASSLNASPGEIYFVSGGTESNNFALMGMAKTEFAESGKNKIITTAGEHKCILEPLEELQKSGFTSFQVPVNSDSLLIVPELQNYLDPHTVLVSVIHCNNETGALNDASHIARLVHANGSLFHTDAVQSFGKIKIDVKTLGADSVSISSHKINGPKGAGALYARSGTPLSPIIFGGSQERNRRGGTENP
ncbi:MAG: cysteine desulfurase family protein, partial [Syntrophothermus sp.]